MPSTPIKRHNSNMQTPGGLDLACDDELDDFITIWGQEPIGSEINWDEVFHEDAQEPNEVLYDIIQPIFYDHVCQNSPNPSCKACLQTFYPVYARFFWTSHLIHDLVFPFTDADYTAQKKEALSFPADFPKKYISSPWVDFEFQDLLDAKFFTLIREYDLSKPGFLGEVHTRMVHHEFRTRTNIEAYFWDIIHMDLLDTSFDEMDQKRAYKRALERIIAIRIGMSYLRSIAHNWDVVRSMNYRMHPNRTRFNTAQLQRLAIEQTLVDARALTYIPFTINYDTQQAYDQNNPFFLLLERPF
jgi:hypothetical protein